MERDLVHNVPVHLQDAEIAALLLDQIAGPQVIHAEGQDKSAHGQPESERPFDKNVTQQSRQPENQEFSDHRGLKVETVAADGSNEVTYFLKLPITVIEAKQQSGGDQPKSHRKNAIEPPAAQLRIAREKPGGGSEEYVPQHDEHAQQHRPNV